jgi:hypothetical protein
MTYRKIQRISTIAQLNALALALNLCEIQSEKFWKFNYKSDRVGMIIALSLSLSLSLIHM